MSANLYSVWGFSHNIIIIIIIVNSPASARAGCRSTTVVVVVVVSCRVVLLEVSNIACVIISRSRTRKEGWVLYSSWQVVIQNPVVCAENSARTHVHKHAHWAPTHWGLYPGIHQPGLSRTEDDSCELISDFINYHLWFARGCSGGDGITGYVVQCIIHLLLLLLLSKDGKKPKYKEDTGL